MTLAEFRIRVRAYANDPATTGTLGKTGVNELFPDAMIDAIGEDEYTEACALLRRHSPGFFRKTLITATSSTQQYTWPSDFVRLTGPMVISSDGTSLETDGETAGEEVVKGVTYNIRAALDNNNQLWYVPEEGGFRLYPKVSTTGLKSWLLRYEYIPTMPSTASETFTWPASHDSYLTVRTAMALRDIANMNTQKLEKSLARKEANLLIDLKTIDLETDQFPSSFWEDEYAEVSKQGKVV
jgi:hypothetical protein